MEYQEKKCTKCGELKPVSEFSKNKCSKDGYGSYCKECIKQYYQNNKKERKKKYKQYYQDNKEKFKTEFAICSNCGRTFKTTKSQLKKSKNHYCCRKCFFESKRTGKYVRCENCGKEFYIANYRKSKSGYFFCSKDCANKYRVEGKYVRCENCGKKVYKIKTELKKNNHNFCSHKCRGEYLRKTIELRCDNCGKIFTRKYSIYLRDKERKTDKIFCSMKCHLKYQKKQVNYIKNRINKSISSLILKALKHNKNGYHWEIIVGYTLDDLIKHLESQFTDGMTWDNYGKIGWHIDHIKPISWFNFTSYEDKEFKECWSLDNLQPLWAEDNLSKGNRYIG